MAKYLRGVSSKDDILNWLITRNFSDVLSYASYETFLASCFYMLVNLTEGHIDVLEIGPDVQTARSERGTDYDSVMSVMIETTIRSVHKKDVSAFYDREKLMESFAKGERYLSARFQRYTGDTWRWVKTCCTLYWDQENGGIRACFLTYDYDVYRRSIEKVHHLAERDGLTSLYNRTHGTAQIEKYIRDNPRGAGLLLMLDIDNFKVFNDRFGHVFGDEVLKHLARSMENRFDRDSILTRLGGDEFMIFIMDTDEAEGLPEIRGFSGEEREVVLDGQESSYSISIGYAVYPEQGARFEDLSRHADQALYQVKLGKKGGFVRYAPDMKKTKREQLGFNLSEVAAGMPGAILIYQAEGDGKILFASQELVKILECESLADFMEFTNHSFLSMVYAEDADKVMASIKGQLAAGRESLDYVRYRVTTRRGTIRHLEHFGHLVHSEYYGDIFYVFIHDLKNKEVLLSGIDAGDDAVALLMETSADGLTGLPDLRYLRVMARTTLREYRRREKLPVFVYLNIRHFKAYNEMRGFAAGDRLLKTIATILQDTFADSTICRMGDDRFVLITEMEGVEDRIDACRAHVHHFEKGLAVELIAGIYVPEAQEGRTLEETDVAIDRARTACDAVKKEHGVSFRYYEPAIDEARALQKYVTEHLSDAIEQGDISIFLQPIVDVQTGEIRCQEALTRWTDETHGAISPTVFVDILEEFRMIHILDYHVLDMVCALQRKRLDEGEPVTPISFNLSRLDFELTDAVRMTEQALSKYRLPKHLVIIEITESIVSKDAVFLRDEIKQFIERGFTIWMDDFGSGASSLNVLQDYTFHALKLDMRFIDDALTNERSEMIIRAMITMAKRMGIRPLVKGVEIPEQVLFLREAGCELAQGYYFGRPGPDYRV